MYILDQRLRAQGVEQEKAKKVIHDIVGTMFNKRFMDELFKPQEMYSKKALRTVFDRLAHASIMRLNTASMDKLYDLMTMAFKYQVSTCLQPHDILLVTLNHLDAIRQYVTESQTAAALVQNVYQLVLKVYGGMSHGEFLLVRQTLMIFFQDLHIRVSIFLKDKVQNSNGRFILPTSGELPWSTDPPGKIKLFTAAGAVAKEVSFSAKAQYKKVAKAGSREMTGDRVTKLGTNMYNVSRPVETTVVAPPVVNRTTYSSDLDSRPSNPNSKAQLDLLARLIAPPGGSAANKKASQFRLNLFNTDEEETEAEQERPIPVLESGPNLIRIDARKSQPNAELDRIMGELSVDGASSSNQDDDDLLALMDIA